MLQVGRPVGVTAKDASCAIADAMISAIWGRMLVDGANKVPTIMMEVDLVRSCGSKNTSPSALYSERSMATVA